MDPSSPTRRSRSWWGQNCNSTQDAQIEPDPAGASRPTPPSPHQPVQDACSEPDPPLCSPPPQLVACPEPDPAGAPLCSPPPYPPRILHHTLAVCVEGAPLPSPPPPLSVAPRFKVLSLLDSDEDVPSPSHSTGGFTTLPLLDDGDSLTSDSSSSDGDEDGRLSEDEASKPKVEEKKYSKKEILKHNADRKKKFMVDALQKYNTEADLPGDMQFVFDEIKEEVYVIEEDMKFYEHFNFTAKQAGSTVLFFAEVAPHGDDCDVLFCKPLDSNDHGHCFSCKNQDCVNMRHPADEALYVGGHEDIEFPLMWDSISEDDSD